MLVEAWDIYVSQEDSNGTFRSEDSETAVT